MSGFAQDANFTRSGQQWKIGHTGESAANSFSAVNGNDLVLQAVPEPTTWALLAFSLITIMVLRQRKQRKT